MQQTSPPRPLMTPRTSPSAELELDFAVEDIVDLQSGRRVAAELLARPRSGIGFERWMSTSRPQMAARVTRAALLRYGAMAPQEVPVHVNITGLDLERPELVHEVQSALSPVRCRSLVLEVTEHYPIQDSQGTRTAIDRLRSMGVRFAVDDFGEGWSNFNALRIVKPEVIKVTLGMLGGDAPDERLARWVVEAARSWPRTMTVLEQLETERHVEWARSLGFDAGQGYWWKAGHRAAG